MKLFILLSLFSFTAHSACDNSSAGNCDSNFQCLQSALRNSESKPEEIEAFVEFSQKNKCQDELRVTNLYAQVIRENGDTQDKELYVNDSERGNNTKYDLPVIPDAPEEASTRVLEQ